MLRTDDESRRYLHPATLSRIASLELRARTVVEGFLGGMHRSPYQGVSVEFAQHRAYAQGDDLRHLDWKVFGRTDKLYVKQYAQETNLLCVLAVDASESMGYSAGPGAFRLPSDGGEDGDGSPASALPAAWTKYDYGSTLAASLAYLALQQGDAVGVAVFDERVRRWVRPSSQGAAWDAVVQGLQGGVGPRRTSLRAALDDLAGRLERRALLILVSDLLDKPDETIGGLRRLRYRGHDVIVMHVLHGDELAFPFRGPTLFDGLEAAGRMQVDPLALREQYLLEVQRFVHGLRTHCRGLHVDYGLLSTEDPLELALSRFLAMRAASIRT